MTVKLYTDPLTPPMSWEKFKETKPSYSIALDGYVCTGPRYDLEGPWLNFNHHEDCDRLATRATCGQVLMAIKQGLFDSLKKNEVTKALVWVNDCDEDVCVSWFLLRHWTMVEKNAYMKLSRLVSVADALDSTAGAFPYPKDLPILQDLAWVFDPYRQFRVKGGLDRKNAEEYENIIEEVGDRILLHITGQGEQIPLDCRYKVLHQEQNFTVIEEIGTQAKTGIFGDNIKAYISVRERPNNKYTYTVGRLSPFIAKFDVPKLLEALNKAENLQNSEDKWGGGNTIGGSPRVSGSKLTPPEVIEIVKSCIEREVKSQ